MQVDFIVDCSFHSWPAFATVQEACNCVHLHGETRDEHHFVACHFFVWPDHPLNDDEVVPIRNVGYPLELSFGGLMSFWCLHSSYSTYWTLVRFVLFVSWLFKCVSLVFGSPLTPPLIVNSFPTESESLPQMPQFEDLQHKQVWVSPQNLRGHNRHPNGNLLNSLIIYVEADQLDDESAPKIDLCCGQWGILSWYVWSATLVAFWNWRDKIHRKQTCSVLVFSFTKLLLGRPNNKAGSSHTKHSLGQNAWRHVCRVCTAVLCHLDSLPRNCSWHFFKEAQRRFISAEPHDFRVGRKTPKQWTVKRPHLINPSDPAKLLTTRHRRTQRNHRSNAPKKTLTRIKARIRVDEPSENESTSFDTPFFYQRPSDGFVNKELPMN